MELAGKVAIVTGGAVRIGRALALSLARNGVRVCVHHGQSVTAAKETVAVILEEAGDATSVQADLRRPADAARQVIDHAVEQFGGADILINSAAIFRPGNCRTTTERDWDDHFAINLKSPYFLVRRFVERLTSGKRAHVINISDWRAQRPGADYLAYSLTKSALEAMTRSLAQELAPDVQVNAIAPGAILPPAGKDKAYLQRISEQIPLKRIGDPAEIAEAMLYLLRSDFVTGEILGVTGGEQL